MNKIHITKRDTLPLYINIAIRGGAIILALLVCALVTTVLTGENPLSIYGTILKGAFGTARKSWTTWENVAILLGISLAVTPAFKMRFWNIGAEGQVLIGCLASATCMITLGDKIPNGLLLVIMFVASLGMGALWGFLPGFFKARWNTNETLFTLMMNYIATQLVAYFIIIWEVPKGAGKIGIINQDSQAGWLPTIGNQKYLLAILVVAVMTGLMYIYLNYSKQGYEIAVVGESQRTASYAGIKVERVIIRTMVLSGAVCGLMGLLLTAGTDHTLTTTIVGGRGFTAVMVSWMAKFNPIIMIFTSLLLVVLGPLAGLELSDLALRYEDLSRDMERQAEAYRQEGQAQLELGIQQRTAAYISEKAAQLGLSCRPRVETAWRDGVPYPSGVTLDIAENQALAEVLTDELGIPPSQQHWLG